MAAHPHTPVLALIVNNVLSSRLARPKASDELAQPAGDPVAAAPISGLAVVTLTLILREVAKPSF